MKLLLLGQLLLTACGSAEMGEFDPGFIDGGTVETLGSPIYAGDFVEGKTGVVRIESSGGGCTGTLIGPKTLLTAAHCMPPEGTTSPVDVFYYRPGRPSDLTLGEHLGQYQVISLTRNGANDKDDHFDIGVLVLNDPNNVKWARTDYHDYVRVYNSGTMPNWFYTYGAGYQWRNDTGDDVLRVGHFERLALYDLYATLNSGDEGICHGDSGGPSMMSGDGQEMVAGVTSGMDTGGDRCADDGDDWNFTRTSNTNGQFLLAAATECKVVRAQSYGYLRCFEIPFISDVTDTDVKYTKQVATALAMGALAL